MTCEPTQTPAPDEIDIPALRDRYRQERDKRLRPEGQQQYVETEHDFAASYEGDPHMPVAPRRWGIDVIEGRDGKSLYDHWAEGYQTLHGAMTCGFPNQFFTGYLQGGFNATTTEQFSRQGYHIAYIIKEALARGAKVVEPSQGAQDTWVKTIRQNAFDLTRFQRECTPGYFNNEGSQKMRWYLGESYGLGWDAFEGLLQEWRNNGALNGLIVA
jgi:cyclohexanone monooxygenase